MIAVAPAVRRQHGFVFLMLLLPLLMAPRVLAEEPARAADGYLLRGATIYDGSGKPPVKGDLLIRGERIVALGMVQVEGKPVVIDARGLIVAPGFIDLHTHSDDAMTQTKTRANLNYLTQGVTTVVTGNCGAGPIDVAAYFKKMEDTGIGSNVVHLVPHNAVRRKAMGNVNRPPTAQELHRMEALVDQGMKDGAYGMSTGLIYNPGTYSKTDELIALARVVSRHGGLYASHIRNEGTGVLAATEEALTIGREARVPVHISHMKASGQKAWGKSADQIAMVLRARKEGQVVTADQYPYIASSTSLSATLIPTRFREGSAKDFLERLKDPEQEKLIRRGIEANLQDKDGGARIRLASYKPNPQWSGKTLAELARTEKKNVVDLVLEIERNGGAGIVNFGMSEEDVRQIMKQTFVATASDGSARVPDEVSVPHPRSYGCFPRKIGRYALQDQVISLEHAIRSASGLPADILRLPERGYLRKGYHADVVVFDPHKFRDVATFEMPHQYSTGVRYLFVNGQLAIKEGVFTKIYAGKVLRHQEPTRRD